MSRLVVIIPMCLPVTQDTMTKYFSQKAAYWHWSPDVWLLRYREEKTAAQLRGEIGRLLPAVQFLVMTIQSQGEWAGFGTPEWQDWFNKYWDTPI
jgi:hypothetical protein